MNPQETQQVIARDEKWDPSTERVKISPTTVRLETMVHQKEETFQVIIDVIKNSTCFKAFTISAEVPEIFMQQKILDICPRVEGEEFTETILNSPKSSSSLPLTTQVSLQAKVSTLSHNKDDGIVSRLKFVKIGEDYQEYGLPIPDMMLNDKIKQS
ncbi:hypothetical protein Tco_0184683 [Tanacetum coccineum]